MTRDHLIFDDSELEGCSKTFDSRVLFWFFFFLEVGWLFASVLILPRLALCNLGRGSLLRDPSRRYSVKMLLRDRFLPRRLPFEVEERGDAACALTFLSLFSDWRSFLPSWDTWSPALFFLSLISSELFIRKYLGSVCRETASSRSQDPKKKTLSVCRRRSVYSNCLLVNLDSVVRSGGFLAL
jgi:hypothetical protein